MSGPKVVRVISLEEKQQTVKKHQTKMLFVLNELRKFISENQQLTAQLKATLEQRQALFETYNENHFEGIATLAEEHVSFLNALHEEVKSNLVELKQQRKNRIRQIKMASKSLQLAFEQRQLEAPNSLTQLTNLSLDTQAEQLPQLEKDLQTSLESLTELSLPKNTIPLEGELLSLQSRLKTDTSVEPLENWIKTQKPIINKQQQRIDRLLSHLELINIPTGQQSELQALINRAKELEQSHANKKASQHTLQLDSLLLDVSQFTQEQETLQNLKASLQQAVSAIQEGIFIADTENARTTVARLQAAISTPKVTQNELEKVLEEAQLFILNQEKAYTSQSRRSAVLSGLSDLGYQVTEGMSTAWVEDGRLVVQKVTAKDYGIELTTNPEMQRLQARVVVNSDASQRSPDSDTQAEEVWCGDFSSLKEIIQAQSGELIIDKMLPIGSQKLKELDFENQGDKERERQYKHQQGQLKSRST